jgi:hypothetical protein
MVFLFLDKAVEKFTVKVTKVIADENLTQEQVYSAEETLPFGAIAQKDPACRLQGSPAGRKDAKRRTTVSRVPTAQVRTRGNLLWSAKDVPHVLNLTF